MSESPFTRSVLSDLEPQVIAVAKAAGQAILEIYAGSFTVQDKADKTPLTEADLAAHQTIVQGLAELAVDYPVLSEEDVVPFEQRRQWTTYWLVDPLDGTKEFIKRNGEFGVNIALVHQHRPVLGVVFAPVLERTYVASLGNGAYVINGAGQREVIEVSEAEQPIRITASRSHPGPRTEAYLNTLAQELGELSIVPMGSSLKSCVVAEGRADIYPRLGKTSEWDTAACQIIVEEAGGTMQTLHGSPMRYNTKESLLNPEFMVVGDDSKDWVALYKKIEEY